MSFTTDTNQLIIAGLIFLLGLLVGVLLTAGGRRKWKTRYDSEVERRREIERTHQDREKHWTAQEKEWRERDSLRAAAIKDRDGDGIRDDREI